jgi:hypothetical protein
MASTTKKWPPNFFLKKDNRVRLAFQLLLSAFDVHPVEHGQWPARIPAGRRAGARRFSPVHGCAVEVAPGSGGPAQSAGMRPG